MFRLFLTIFFLASVGQSLHAQLPVSDADQKQLIFVGESPTLDQWFRTHPGLGSLASKVKVHRYAADSVLFRERYASSMPAGSHPPVLLFVRGDSGVIFCATRETMPGSAESLFQQMKSAYALSKEKPLQPSADASYSQFSDSYSGFGETQNHDERLRLRDRLRDSVIKTPSLLSPLDAVEDRLRQITADHVILLLVTVIAGVVVANLAFPRN